MSRYVEFELPDGETVIIESDEPESGVVETAIKGLPELTSRGSR